MMNNTTPLKYQGRSLEDLKSSLRAINHQIDSIKQDAAICVGVLPLKPGRKFWVADEINWDDSRVDHLKETYFELKAKSSMLTYTIGKLEAEANGNVETWETDKKINEFLKDNFTSFEEEIEFFKKNNLVRGTSSLKECLLKNPNFLEEVLL